LPSCSGRELGATAALQTQPGRASSRISAKPKPRRTSFIARRSSERDQLRGERASSPNPLLSQLSTTTKLYIGWTIGSLAAPYTDPLIDRAVDAGALLLRSLLVISEADAQRGSLYSLRFVSIYALLLYLNRVYSDSTDGESRAAIFVSAYV